MNKKIINRVYDESNYILDTKKTIREIASVYNVSKSTVHKDLHERLRELDYYMFLKVNDILQFHADVRHIRGGESTKKKYLKLASN